MRHRRPAGIPNDADGIPRSDVLTLVKPDRTVLQMCVQGDSFGTLDKHMIADEGTPIRSCDSDGKKALDESQTSVRPQTMNPPTIAASVSRDGNSARGRGEYRGPPGRKGRCRNSNPRVDEDVRTERSPAPPCWTHEVISEALPEKVSTVGWHVRRRGSKRSPFATEREFQQG
jgi:hypothetical protein